MGGMCSLLPYGTEGCHNAVIEQLVFLFCFVFYCFCPFLFCIFFNLEPIK